MKLRIDLLSLLMLAILLGAAVLLWGEELGIKTPGQQGLWLIAIAAGALLLAILLLFDRPVRWLKATHALLAWRQSSAGQIAGATQAQVPVTFGGQPPRAHALDHLRCHLQDQHGWRWRYRLPWLLVTGHDAAIASLLPSLVEHGYLIAEDLVLLWHAPEAGGQPDKAWLKQLYALRRRRPVDGVVFVTEGEQDPAAQAAGMPSARMRLARISQSLHWSAPVYVLDALPMQAEDLVASTPLLAGYACAPRGDAAAIEAGLLALRDRLAHLGVRRLSTQRDDFFAALLSQRLDTRAAALADWLARLTRPCIPVRGVFFAPVASPMDEANPSPMPAQPLWAHLGSLAHRERGRPTRTHPITLGALLGLALTALWSAGMLIAAFSNAGDLHRSQSAIRALRQGDDAARLRALLALQQRIALYEDRLHDPASLLHGFGLNRDRQTLAALWASYAPASRALLVQPLQRSLEASLQALAHARADAVPSQATQQRDYAALKTYLMLAQPARVEPGFLAPQLVSAWPMVTGLSPGEWLDTAQQLAGFFAQHLSTHPDWAIRASPALIAATRGLLIRQVGLANAEDAVYHAILDGVRGKYADASLPMLLHGTDAQGLFTTTQTVPGIYTRAAWDGMIAEAIDKAASEHHAQADWVLSGDAAAAKDSQPNADALKQRLTARYFADYAAAWQHMLNSLQWQPPADLNAAIDQLTRLTDAQTSPLIALLRSVQAQAQAGRSTQALADTLVQRAQSLIGHDQAKPDTPSATSGPLDAAFAPLLALMGQPDGMPRPAGDAAGASATLAGVSLQSYLTNATALRLKLQQIASSPDPAEMARAMAQAVFQGKLSELAQMRDQAALTAASLGSAWSGFGQALFARPIDAAWQTILQPATASLNALWRSSIAMPFDTAFNGRYPFFDTQADASFAELSRYVRPDTGLIAQFLATQLGGVLTRQGDQWVPRSLAPATLRFDPAFLKAIQQLDTLGAHLCPQGDAGYRFQMMALPTPNVVRTTLTIDQQQIVYFNQRESWTPLRWPGDGLYDHAALAWQPLDTSQRTAFDAPGDWAFLRLLAQAQVKQLDSARYALTWQQPGAEPLRYVLRTQIGAGPLELLSLRDFRMPQQVFALEEDTVSPHSSGLPPKRVLP